MNVVVYVGNFLLNETFETNWHPSNIWGVSAPRMVYFHSSVMHNTRLLHVVTFEILLCRYAYAPIFDGMRE